MVFIIFFLILELINILFLQCSILKNRWNNSLLTLSSINFRVSRVYRKGNQCADLLANPDLSSFTLTVWLDMFICIIDFFLSKTS